MKAALYKGIRDIEIVDRPRPHAGPGEAVVRIRLCGICGTDLHAYFEGDLAPGIVLGHENVGVVEELGEGVEGLAVGDRVVAGPPGNCGRCYHCLHGRPSICVDGYERTNGLRRDGGMAEYLLVEDARQMLYRIPDNVPFEDAVLVDIYATPYHGLMLSSFKMGDNVVVSGAGPIGLAAVQLLRLGGARHITVLEIVEEKRSLARRFGADLALDPAAEADVLPGRVAEFYGGLGADLVVECAGVSRSFELCLTLTRAGGEILNLGATGQPVALDPSFLTFRELTLRSTLAFGAEEARVVLDYLASGKIETDGMLSDVVSLDDVVDKGFERLRADRSLVKVAVAPWLVRLLTAREAFCHNA